MSWEELMAEHVHELRWWSVEELLEAGRQGVRFAPPELPALLAAVVTHGPPPTPLVIGP